MVLLVVPAFLIHAFFLGDPEPLPRLLTARPAEALQPAPSEYQRGMSNWSAPVKVRPPAPQIELPKAEEVRPLIERTETFASAKRASCPTAGPTPDIVRYPLISALRSAGYLEAEPDSERGPDETRVFLTPAARYDLGGDLTEDPSTITVLIARKVFLQIVSIDPPPQALPPPMRYATRVDFLWKWSATNRLAGYLNFLPGSSELSGTAYFQRQPDLSWRLAQIDLNDTTPDLTRRR